MRHINIDLSSDNHLQQMQIFGGYAGEHNETILQIKLPRRMVGIDCSGYRFDFQTSEDNKITSPLIFPEDLNIDILQYHLTEQLTIAGKLLFNVVAIKQLNQNSCSLVSKTNMVTLYIGNSPDGNDIPYDPNGYKDEILAMIDARILEINPAQVDQSYDAKSTHAQSGKAVAEAIANAAGGGSIDPAILQRKIEPWQPNTAYKVGDMVVAKTYDNESDSIDTVIAICIEEHVSSDTRQLVIEQDGSNWSYNSLYAKYDSSGNIINNYYATKEELNNKFSTGLKREVVDNFITPDMAEDNVIYMVPDPNATEDNNYLEYIKTKHKYSVANGQDYIYAKDESEFSIILLRNGLFVTMVGDDYIDRPEVVHITFNGFNPINEIQEDITVTVDNAESYLKSYIIDLDLNGQPVIVNLGDGFNEWESTPEDDDMKSFGYIYRSQISYEIFSERESMELIGSTAVDLSAYATKTYVGNVVNSAIDKTYSASVNKKSEKAQSGIAVDAAITQRVSLINGKINSLTSSVNSLISSSISREIVDILPEKEQAKINTIYMVKNNSTDDNVYDEYLAINVPQEDIIFNNIPATIRFKTSGDNIEDNSELSVKNTTFSIYITSSDGTNPNIRQIIPDSSDIDHFIQLNINEIDNSLVTLIDENKYQLISYSGYTNGIINKLSFNINKTVYELIGSTAVDLSDYYTKSEINEQIGDIETALDGIIAIQDSLIGGDS